MKRLLLLGVALVLVLAVAGCGETVIDSAKTEGAIEHDLEKSVGLKIASVDCPSDVEVKAGTKFQCVVTETGGKKQTATLKILNEDADVSLVDLSPNK
jgi:hypothetical protein